MAVALVSTVLFLVFVDPIVAVMSTPGEAVSGTVRYLTICFMGIPFITAYNIISSIFRGMGDSKSPMYFIAVACGANIVLDYVFIGACHLGPSGAALGTVLSQTISVITALIVILRRKTGISLKKQDFRPDAEVMKQVLKIGIPVALQDGFIQIAFIVITVIANRRGLNDAAAVGIVEKLIGIVFLVPSTMLSAVSALSAQNIGAGKPERAVKTLKYAVMISVGFGFTVAVLTQFVSVTVVKLFTDDAAVAVSGGQYLRSYIGYFCACGRSGISFLHNFLSIICARVPGAYLASVYFPDTLYPMGLAAPAGSLLSGVICVAAFVYLQKCRKGREGYA